MRLTERGVADISLVFYNGIKLSCGFTLAYLCAMRDTQWRGRNANHG